MFKQMVDGVSINRCCCQNDDFFLLLPPLLALKMHLNWLKGITERYKVATCFYFKLWSSVLDRFFIIQIHFKIPMFLCRDFVLITTFYHDCRRSKTNFLPFSLFMMCFLHSCHVVFPAAFVATKLLGWWYLSHKKSSPFS